jgi:5-formyltetrahydrofolate cyclo-ligase
MLDKALLRKEVFRKRDAIPLEVRRVKNGLIRDRLLSLDEIKSSNKLLFFASFRTEVDTSEMIEKILSEGKRAVLPKVDRERHILLLYEIKGVDDLKPGYMGIPEPSFAADNFPLPSFNKGGAGGFAENRLIDINEVDIVIVPGAGFDLSGNRIGYGEGYYDRLLSGLKREIPILALAYEEQVIDAIPSEPYDVKVHAIATDRRVIRCREMKD